MKAESLRIGNYFRVKADQRILTVSAIETDFDEFTNNQNSVNDFPINEIEPIELTEEWLERFKFTSDNYNVFYITDNRKSNGRTELWIHPHDKDGETIWDCHIGIEFGELTFVRLIRHVHQLQNLFFALTGTELTVLNDRR